jgi:hypothetical protein
MTLEFMFLDFWTVDVVVTGDYPALPLASMMNQHFG